MAITVIQAAPVVQAASLTTATVTLANPTGAGNSLVVAVTAGALTTPPSVSGITLGGSADNFTAVETNTAGSVVRGAVWYDPGCAAGQTSVVVTCTGGVGSSPAIYVAVYEVSGVLVADKHTSAIGAAVTTWSSGATAATAQANEIFIAAATGTTSVPAVTGVGTWTTLTNSTGTYDQISGSQIVSSTGTATFSGTMTSGNFVALVATFSQAAAAGGILPQQARHRAPAVFTRIAAANRGASYTR